MKKPELLAPAGDYKSFIAAVEAGADAVYFGGKDFSARVAAANLGREEIRLAVDYAHIRGVKCYAAVNTLVKDKEFGRLFDFINFLYKEGIDALIIQDLGVYNFCRKHWPDLVLHASTQMAAHNLNDVLVLEKMGFKRIILARELTLEEIKDIKEKAKAELECFVHGALCFSYSGRCLMSAMIGDRSGNRGRCAQPCRKRYEVLGFGIEKKTNIEGYLLSTKDLCTVDILDKLQFIDSLKIEGRMKSAEYVGIVVEKYRKHIDALSEGIKKDWKEDKKEMSGIFNRGGFSHGYFLKKKPGDIVSIERSKNFGVKAGEVIEAHNGRMKIKAENAAVNDGLEIWGRGGQEKNFGFRVEKISNGIIEVESRGDIKAGDAVYRTFDYNLNKKLSSQWKENSRKSMPLSLKFFGRAGKPIALKINNIEVEGEEAMAAKKLATSEKTIREQLAKFGGTTFFAEKIEVDIEGGLNIPLKNINDLRRKGVAKLTEEITRSYKRQGKNYKEEIFAKEKTGKKNICVQSDDKDVLKSLLGKGIRRIYTAVKIDAGKFHKDGIEVFQALPAILRKGEKVELFEDYDGFLVPSLGYLKILPEKSRKIADYSLNIFNNYSVRQLKDMGLEGFTSSPENTLEEINAIAGKGIEKETIVYGHFCIMTSEHCVLFGTKFCREKNLGIKDDFGVTFPVYTDCENCRMQVLNSEPLYFIDVDNISANNIRLIHTIERPEKFLAIADSYLTGKFTNKKNTTTGHFYRGVE